MASEGRHLLAADCAQKTRERRHERKWEEVFHRLGQSRLIGDRVRQVRECEPLLLEFPPIDASREGDWLEADRRDRIDVCEREPNDVTNLMVVYALHDRRN